MSRALDYVEHIRKAALQACTYIEGLSKEDFLVDIKTQQAVILNLIIIGEAATKLLDMYGDYANQYQGIPWQSMRGMRNRLAHGYFEINLEIVWETVNTALPDLVKNLNITHPSS